MAAHSTDQPKEDSSLSPRKWNRNTLSTRMQSGNTAIIVHHLQLTVMLSVYPNPAMAESITPLEYVLFAALFTRKKATVNKTVCPQVCVVRCLVWAKENEAREQAFLFLCAVYRLAHPHSSEVAGTKRRRGKRPVTQSKARNKDNSPAQSDSTLGTPPTHTRTREHSLTAHSQKAPWERQAFCCCDPPEKKGTHVSVSI